MITPSQIEQVARHLEENGCEEAFLRSAASRYYYAIYHMLMLSLVERDKPLMKAEQGGSHEDLLFSLEKSGDTTLKRAAYAAREAKNLRVVADYNLSTDFSPDMCRKVAQTAERVEKLLSG